jgi:hypothetical protein
MPARPARLQLIASSASPEEAAAIVAALERFMRATAPPPRPRGVLPDEWQLAAVAEGVEREAHGELGDPWLTG